MVVLDRYAGPRAEDRLQRQFDEVLHRQATNIVRPHATPYTPHAIAYPALPFIPATRSNADVEDNSLPPVNETQPYQNDNGNYGYLVGYKESNSVLPLFISGRAARIFEQAVGWHVGRAKSPRLTWFGNRFVMVA